MKTTLRIALIALALVSIAVSASADPRQWDTTGVPIRQGKHIEWHREVAQDADGNMLVVWSDLRTGISAIYAQLINPAGLAVWTDEGVLVADNPATQDDPVVTAVADGWIVAWIDFGDDSTGNVWAQKLSLTGSAVWDTRGIPVAEPSDAIIIEMSVRVVHDGDGGAFIAWESNLNDQGDIFVQRILANGTSAWTTWLSVCNETGTQSGSSVDNDEAGNMFIAWNDRRDPTNQNIYAAKVTADGQIPWGVNGLLVCGRAEEQRNVRLCRNGLGGCYLVWQDRNPGPTNNLFMQHLNGDGQPYSAAWIQDGLELCNAPSDQRNVSLALSRNQGAPDGCLAVWEDQRIDDFTREVYTQKVSSEGQMQWAANGVKVWGDAQVPPGHSCTNPRPVSDKVGGLVCVWEDTRTDELKDIRASRILANGTFAWSESGIAVVVAPNWQLSPAVFVHGMEAMFCWNDRRTGSSGLRYQKLGLEAGNTLLNPEGVEFVYGLDGDAEQPQLITMTQGRVAMVWSDGRLTNGGSLIYYQVINTNGSIERAVNGDPVSPANQSESIAHQRNHNVCPDGSGGFFVCYEDQRTQVNLIRVSHVNSAGQVDVSPEGIPVWPSDWDQSEAFLCPDGSGGFYAGWSGFNVNFYDEVFVLRFNAVCQPIWTQPVRFARPETDELMKGMIVNPDGSCTILWRTGNYPQNDIRSARIGPNGTVVWNSLVCDATGRQDTPTMVADGLGGSYLAWTDERDQTLGKDIYVQHLTSGGVESWAHNGRIAVSMPFPQQKPTLSLGSQGGVLVAWEDYRSGSFLDLYMQKIAPNGDLLWEESGRPLCTVSGDQQQLNIVSDHADGMAVVWADYRQLYSRIFATHVDSTGLFVDDQYWEAESGGLVGQSAWNCNSPVIAHDGEGGYIVAWEHGETIDESPVEDIWAQRIYDGFGVQNARRVSTTLPTQYVLNQNYPNPFNPSTEISFALPQPDHVSLKIFDVLGRQVETLIDGKMNAGQFAISYDASRLPSGVYVYRLEAGSFSSTRKMIVLK